MTTAYMTADQAIALVKSGDGEVQSSCRKELGGHLLNVIRYGEPVVYKVNVPWQRDKSDALLAALGVDDSILG
jgi:hypothetical protein